MDRLKQMLQSALDSGITRADRPELWTPDFDSGFSFREARQPLGTDEAYGRAGCVTVPAGSPKEEAMPMTPEETMDAIKSELASLADSLSDLGYPFHLVWLSMLMFVFESPGPRKGQGQRMARYQAVG
jgi:hypothetical protein